MRMPALYISNSQIEAPELTAIVAIKRGIRDGAFAMCPSGAGVVLYGCGNLQHFWIAGVSTSDDPVRASGVAHTLLHYRGNNKLTVLTKGLTEQLSHVRDSRGRNSNNTKRFCGYAALKPVQEALDRGDFNLQTFRTKGEPEGYKSALYLAEQAVELVKGRMKSQMECKDFDIFKTSDGLPSVLEGGANARS